VPISSGRTPAPFTLLAKPAGAACNLACTYCFYLGKDQLYPDSRLRMTDKVLKSYIKQLLASQQAGEVSVAWQGGEPSLMGLDFFQRSVELVNKYKRPGQRVAYSLQTNGTLLDDDWCAFFKQHDFLIGLSLDGPAEMHNTYRVDKGGQGSFGQVRRGWDLLQKHDVDTNILCAVHAMNASHPLEVYHFFRDTLQARFIQFIPIVERRMPGTRLQAVKGERSLAREQNTLPLREDHLVSNCSVKPRQYGSFLIEIFEDWVHHDVGTVFVQTFDSALASWSHFPASVCISQEVCGFSLVLEHNGDLYSCDHFVEAAHRLGNILETPLVELASLPRQHQFGLDKLDRLPADCRGCDVLFACHGECPRNRFINYSAAGATGDADQGLNYLCAAYQLFFHHVDRPMQIMANLLRRGQAPAEIMQMES